jgi:hypothetical protein
MIKTEKATPAKVISDLEVMGVPKGIIKVERWMEATIDGTMKFVVVFGFHSMRQNRRLGAVTSFPIYPWAILKGTYDYYEALQSVINQFSADR